ncbi:Molybdopterin synthase catalytic subunit [Pseudomonas sp. THAF187a]|uniref:molybdenum cofactor biosynthesis protein MoaE n=1 Tax=unclassified Pseudomonas TaxID=196821 RepID=UPI001268A22A|nr:MULTISPECIES: molybdenum cofactor biosynthesis protein MoaE [unclassified Pseudomonas]QFT22678.1 Molybdopterin synthase catalytic subunit [Pseudomonas sp. THAF187a]QFT42865.1 Molybdopterin synthase catalytic subunit [Pseudomonas sp. THAF42]
MSVQVQAHSFSAAQLLDQLQERCAGVGALASFVGLVRDYGDAGEVRAMFLEHYPGMTERALAGIEAEARVRWPLHEVLIVHRHGLLQAAEPIVFVGVGSAHRQVAFEACAYLMDQLKTRAPFWKKEMCAQGAQWVDARASDAVAARRW